MKLIHLAAICAAAAVLAPLPRAAAAGTVQEGQAGLAEPRQAPGADCLPAGSGLPACAAAERPGDAGRHAIEAARSLVERCVAGQTRAAGSRLNDSIRRSIAFACGARPILLGGPRP